VLPMLLRGTIEHENERFPLFEGAKALRPWGLSRWHLAALAYGTTPLAFRLLSLFI